MMSKKIVKMEGEEEEDMEFLEIKMRKIKREYK